MTPASPLDTIRSNSSGSTLVASFTGASPGMLAVNVTAPTAAASTPRATTLSPSATSMLAGTSIAPGLLLSREMRTPPGPAAAGKVKVTVPGSPAVRCAGRPPMANTGGAGALEMAMVRLSTAARLPGSRTVTSTT